MMKTRIRIIAACVFLFSILLFVKLYSLQIIHSEDFRDRADRQYQRPANAFNRGTIYFTDKDGNQISAATLKTGFILALNPKTLQLNGSVDTTYNKLLTVLPDLKYSDYSLKANKPGDSYEELMKQVDENKGAKISALKIPGVSLYKDKWRYYPGGELAAHVLGFMAYKGNDIAGRYGLERSYEDNLKRENDDVYVNFFAELFSNIKQSVAGDLQGDVVTTIEPRTEAYVEDMLKNISRQYGSERSGAIVMDPKTGEIVAMSLYPTFDPNDFKSVTRPELFRNDLVESMNEMGSIIKPLTMAVGIDLGKVHATSTYDDTGSITSDGRTIYNFDKKGRGVITLQYALSKSLNTGFAYVAGRVGNKALTEYFKNFGLGTKTGIDLPNEAAGLIDNLNSPRNIEHITASFGQGIAITPVQVVRAFSAIANGGTLVTPHTVNRIDYRVGISKNIKGDSSVGASPRGDASSTPSANIRVIKESTSKEITDMMVYNVDNSLLEGKAKNPRYSVAAKTGTAQIAVKGGYSDNQYLHSFVGYLPAYNPKFVVFMYTVNPRGVSYASETLAKPFIDLTKFLISYYQLSPDR
ncbi:MAG: penicillin-binding protein 2 [Candidatus Pacebacteria bacterium]|nr:penicillin-binding protein 2 [Candidatus Paceibacterota bacterium]